MAKIFPPFIFPSVKAPGLLLRSFSLFCAVLFLAAGCQSREAPIPTLMAAAATQPGHHASPAAAAVPATWTPLPTSLAQLPSPAPFLTQARPSPTAWPTATTPPVDPPATVSPTTPATTISATAVLPTMTATAIPVPPPINSANLLPNPSFEGGWYHINGVPELQVAEQWQLEWDEGPNPLDPDPWNQFVRPESRVLSADFLPPAEHALFIWDGRQTVKIFKGQGAISFRLLTDVFLQPGTYQFEVNIFPDLVDGYTAGGSKIWAPDPLSGEVRFISGDSGSGWLFPTFGRKNRFDYHFAVAEAQVVRLGLAVRGRWAIENNGWFMDDWSLYRVGQP